MKKTAKEIYIRFKELKDKDTKLGEAQLRLDVQPDDAEAQQLVQTLTDGFTEADALELDQLTEAENEGFDFAEDSLQEYITEDEADEDTLDNDEGFEWNGQVWLTVITD